MTTIWQPLTKEALEKRFDRILWETVISVSKEYNISLPQEYLNRYNKQP